MPTATTRVRRTGITGIAVLLLAALAILLIVPGGISAQGTESQGDPVWSADMLVVAYTEISIGAASADLFSNVGGSGNLQIKSLWSYVPNRDLRLAFTDGVPDAADMTLKVGDLDLEFPSGSSGEASFKWTDVDLDWEDGETIAVSIVRTSTLTEPAGNTPATGAPSITGTPQVDQTLTADISSIADEDGLDGVSYSYQWIRSDNGTDTDIAGETDSTYTLVAADMGKTLKVRVSFTDDAENAESLTSGATSAVTRPPPQPPEIDGISIHDGKLRVSGGRLQLNDSNPSSSVPAADVGEYIASFKVQWKSGSQEYDASRQSVVTPQPVTANVAFYSFMPAYDITGLTNDVEYTVRVIATNAGRDGPPSQEQTATPGTKSEDLWTYIEDEIVEEHEASHQWLRHTLSYLRNNNIPLIVWTDASDPNTVETYSDDASELDPRHVESLNFPVTFVDGPEATKKETILTNLAYIYTMTNGVSSSPAPLGIAHVYFRTVDTLSLSGCWDSRLYLDVVLSLVTQDSLAGASDWNRCVARSEDATALAVVRSALSGQTPAWFADTYHDSEGNPDLDQLWSDVQLIGNTHVGVVAYQLRNSFGGYCDSGPDWGLRISRSLNRSLASAGFDTLVNPWRDGGCVPSAPISLTASLKEEGEASVSWEAPENNGGSLLSGYRIQWQSVDAEEGTTPQTKHVYYDDYSDEARPTQVSETIDGLTDGVDYTVRVLAYNPNGDGTAVEVTVSEPNSDSNSPDTVPVGPTGMSAVVTNDGIDLSWDKVSGDVLRYEVLRQIPRECEEAFTVLASETQDKATNYTDDSVVHGVGYVYAVRAVNSAGTGPRSGAVGVTYTSSDDGTREGVPAAPTNLMAYVTRDGIELEWRSAEDSTITGYQILRRVPSKCESKPRIHKEDTGSTETEALDGDVQKQVAYEYHVRAINANGVSPVSNISKTTMSAVRTGMLIIQYDEIVYETATSTMYVGLHHLVKDSDPDTVDYTVRGEVVNVDDGEKANACAGEGLGTDQHIYTVDERVERLTARFGGKECTKGKYRVEMELLDADLTVVSTVNVDYDVIAYQGSLTSEVKASLPTISGTPRVYETLTADTSAITDEDGLTNVSYSYQWVRNDNGTDSNIVGETSSTYTLVAADAGKTIKVRVTFTDDAENQETLTSEATVAVAAAVPTAPLSLAVTPGDQSQELHASWQAPSSNGGSDVTGYKVQWKESTDSWDTEADVSEATVTGTSHTITGLTGGVEYSVRVVATNIAGDGPGTTEARATPADITAAWTATLTVGVSGGGSEKVWGYNRFVDEMGTLDETTFSEGDQSIEVTGILLANGSVAITVRPHLTNDFVLTVDGTKFASADAREVKSTTIISYIWPTTLEWAEDDTVVLSLTLKDTDSTETSGTPQQAAIWSTTLTVGVTETFAGYTTFLPDSTDLGALSSDTITLDDASYTAKALGVLNGKLIFSVMPKLNAEFVLVAGSDEFTSTDASTRESTSVLQYQWDGSGLTWSEGESIEIRLTAPKQNTPASGAPVITGTVQVGETLTANTSGITDEDGLTNVSYGYQWLADDTNIDGATDSSYTLADAEENKTIKVKVTFTDDEGNHESLTSGATGEVAAKANSVPTGLPTISGTAEIGETLTADTSGIADENGMDNVEFSYQWIRVDDDTETEIEYAAASTYTPGVKDVHKKVKVEVTFTDEDGHEESLTSKQVGPVSLRVYADSVQKIVDQYSGEQISNLPREFWSATMTAASIEDTHVGFHSGENPAGSLDDPTFTYVPGDDYDYTVNLVVLDDDYLSVSFSGSIYLSSADLSQWTLSVNGQEFRIDEAVRDNDILGHPGKKAGMKFADWLFDAIYDAIYNGEGDYDNFDDFYEEAWEYWSRKPVRGWQWPRGDLSFSDGDTVNLSLKDITPPSVGDFLTFVPSLFPIGFALHSHPEYLDQVNLPSPSDFTITSDDTLVTIGEVLPFWEDFIWLGQLSPAIKQGQTVILSYTDPTSADDANAFQDLFGNDAADFTFTVTNFSLLQTDISQSSATGAPTINGTAQVGQVLTAETSGIADENGLTIVEYSYQWLFDDGTEIEGATDSTYTLQETDVGKAVKVKVSFRDDAAYKESLTSIATVAVAATVPTEPLSLTVSTGDQIQELDVSWQAPSSNGGSDVTGYKVQWKEAAHSWDTAADVSEATVTGTSHTITSLTGGVEYTVRVIASNVAGDGPASTEVKGTPAGGVSEQQAVDPANNAPTGLPTINGTPQVEQTLTADTSGINDADGLTNVSYEYQWLAGGSDISGATGSSYVLTSSEQGKTITVRVTFTDDANNQETLTSVATVAIIPQSENAEPVAPIWSADMLVVEYTEISIGAASADLFSNIGGTESLQVRSLWSYTPDRDLRLAFTEAVPDAADMTLQVGDLALAFPAGSSGESSFKWTDVDVDWEDGQTIAVGIVPTSTLASPKPNTAPTGQPTISGTPQVEQTLTADTSTISDEDGLTNVSYRYQWIANDTEIEDASDSTYTPSPSDVGKTIKVKVSFTDDAENDETLTSQASEAVLATVPTEPLSLTVATGDQIQELDASWQAPSSNGGSAVTGYKVQWKEAADSWDTAADVSEATVTGTTHTITGLTGGTEYAVRVIASNTVGAGPASDEVAGTPAGGTSQQQTGDSTSPTVSSIAITSDPGSDEVYAIGDAIQITVTFSADVTVAGKPQLELDIGGNAKPAEYQSTNASSTIFSYTVAEGDSDTDGIAVAENKLTLNGGTIKDASDNAADLDHVALEAQSGHKVDGIRPTISKVRMSGISSARMSGTRANVGDLVHVSVDFTEEIFLDGSPHITLDIDSAASRVASLIQIGLYCPALEASTSDPVLAVNIPEGEEPPPGVTSYCFWSDTHGITMLFHYTVAKGDLDTDGVGIPANSLSLNGGTLRDAAGNDAVITHEAVADNPSVLIDGVPPEITSIEITSDPGEDDTYAEGDTIKFNVTFSEDLEFLGFGWTRLRLDIGGKTRMAYGVKRDILDIRSDETGYIMAYAYTVADGDNDEDGISFPANAHHKIWITVLGTDGNHAIFENEAIADNAEHKVATATTAEDDTDDTQKTGFLMISGTLNVGETVNADFSNVDDEDGVEYAVDTAYFDWSREGGGGGLHSRFDTRYIIGGSDKGKRLRVSTWFVDDNGNEEYLTSPWTEPVGPRAPSNSAPTGLPTITGTPQVDQTLTANTSSIDDGDGLDSVSYSYQWTRSDNGAETDIAGETGSTYTLVLADLGKTIKVKVSFTDDADNDETLTSVATVAVAAAPNRSATGKPAISGTPQVEETLTADTSPIDDQDGLENVSYGYQWTAGGSDIDGATGASFTLTASQQGKTIQVRVTFTDDRNNAEALTSIATAEVAAAPEQLTVSVTAAAPATHDGSSEFTFEIEFSEEFGISYATLKNHAFNVTGGSVERAQRTDKPSNIPWRITVKPHGTGDVTIELPATTDCNAEGAICTGDGRILSNRLEFTVSGPGQ